jgi:hypothetical protein
MKSKNDESSLFFPNSLSVLFKFTESGYLKAVFLNANTKEDQEILEKALDRIIKPSHLNWLRRLFR